MQVEQPLFVNASDAMKLLGISRSKFYRWRNAGIVKPKDGLCGHPMYPVEQLKKLASAA
jgi:predicted site-specific integrase-resolvase